MLMEASDMAAKIKVLVWHECRHEKKSKAVQDIYPEGIHKVIAAGLEEYGGFEGRTATLDDPEQGITEEVLKWADVMTWWGHTAHKDVLDTKVEMVRKAVLEGMGLIVLHSGHYSKIFKALMGTTCSLRWREIGERERVWVCEPGHPIAEGLGECFDLPNTEMYGEPFGIPTPDKLVFISWYQGGDVFRSGCCYERGNGRIFYFAPGHETFPIYYHPQIRKVMGNACKWAARRVTIPDVCPQAKTPCETVPSQKLDLSFMKKA
jgi:trehalose utilization protein